jgi:hypothetical protein
VQASALEINSLRFIILQAKTLEADSTSLFQLSTPEINSLQFIVLQAKTLEAGTTYLVQAVPRTSARIFRVLPPNLYTDILSDLKIKM